MTVHEPVGVRAQTAAMTTAAPPLPSALSVHCPICDAAPGRPCEETASGWIVPAVRPHQYRIAVAQEVTR